MSESNAISSIEPHEVREPILTIAEAPSERPAASPFHRGIPGTVGVPLFIVGALTLGFSLIDFTPTGSVGAPIATIMTATGLFTLVTAVWCIALGENAAGSIFAIFSGFWLTYGVLVLGLLHDWWGLTPPAHASAAVVGADAAATTRTVETFLVCWLVVMVMLTLATLRLPLAFSAIFALVDVAIACVLIGTIVGSQAWHTAGGIAVFGFAGVGMLVYFDAMSQAIGGKPLPLGKPLVG